MTTLMQRYRERMEHQHGWRVELTCTTCGHASVPDFSGWTPSGAIRFGDRATIYADVSCPNCGSDLKSAASERLRELFADVATPARNRLLLGWFVVGLVVASLALPAGIAAGVRAGMWPAIACVAVTILATLWMNYSIASIRSRCACGEPDYVFMGLLGRSYCYRCSTCGRLLRLRD